MKRFYIAIILIIGILGCDKNTDLEERTSLRLSYQIGDTEYSDEGNETFYRKSEEDLIFGFYNASYSNNSILQVGYITKVFGTRFKLPKTGRRMDVEIKKEIDTLLLDSSRRLKNFNDYEFVFTLGSHLYSDYGPKDGVSISYWQDGKRWFSGKHFGINQTVLNHSNFYNSTFEITTVERFYSHAISADVLRVFANFDVTLYNNNSDSLRIENGSFVMLFAL